jgi:hypothetical protein
MAEMITLMNAAGDVLHSEPGKFCKRMSMTAAANQKRLNALVATYPQATQASIGSANIAQRFELRNGRFVWVDCVSA